MRSGSWKKDKCAEKKPLRVRQVSVMDEGAVGVRAAERAFVWLCCSGWLWMVVHALLFKGRLLGIST